MGMRKTLATTLLALGLFGGLGIALSGVGKEDAWKYYLGGSSITFVGTAAAVGVGKKEKYNPNDGYNSHSNH